MEGDLNVAIATAGLVPDFQRRLLPALTSYLVLGPTDRLVDGHPLWQMAVTNLDREDVRRAWQELWELDEDLDEVLDDVLKGLGGARSATAKRGASKLGDLLTRRS